MTTPLSDAAIAEVFDAVCDAERRPPFSYRRWADLPENHRTDMRDLVARIFALAASQREGDSELFAEWARDVKRATVQPGNGLRFGWGEEHENPTLARFYVVAPRDESLRLYERMKALPTPPAPTPRECVTHDALREKFPTLYELADRGGLSFTQAELRALLALTETTNAR